MATSIELNVGAPYAYNAEAAKRFFSDAGIAVLKAKYLGGGTYYFEVAGNYDVGKIKQYIRSYTAGGGGGAGADLAPVMVPRPPTADELRQMEKAVIAAGGDPSTLRSDIKAGGYVYDIPAKKGTETGYFEASQAAQKKTLANIFFSGKTPVAAAREYYAGAGQPPVKPVALPKAPAKGTINVTPEPYKLLSFGPPAAKQSIMPAETALGYEIAKQAKAEEAARRNAPLDVRLAQAITPPRMGQQVPPYQGAYGEPTLEEAGTALLAGQGIRGEYIVQEAAYGLASLPAALVALPRSFAGLYSVGYSIGSKGAAETGMEIYKTMKLTDVVQFGTQAAAMPLLGRIPLPKRVGLKVAAFEERIIAKMPESLRPTRTFKVTAWKGTEVREELVINKRTGEINYKILAKPEFEVYKVKAKAAPKGEPFTVGVQYGPKSPGIKVKTIGAIAGRETRLRLGPEKIIEMPGPFMAEATRLKGFLKAESAAKGAGATEYNAIIAPVTERGMEVFEKLPARGYVLVDRRVLGRAQFAKTPVGPVKSIVRITAVRAQPKAPPEKPIEVIKGAPKAQMFNDLVASIYAKKPPAPKAERPFNIGKLQKAVLVKPEKFFDATIGATREKGALVSLGAEAEAILAAEPVFEPSRMPRMAPMPKARPIMASTLSDGRAQAEAARGRQIELIKPVSMQRIAPVTMLRQETRQAGREAGAKMPLLRQLEMQKQRTGQVEIFKQISEQRTGLLPRLAAPPKPPEPIIPPVIPPPGGGGVPFPRIGKLNLPPGRRALLGPFPGAKAVYRPSLTAVLVGIKAKKPPKLLSGVEFRPVIIRSVKSMAKKKAKKK